MNKIKKTHGFTLVELMVAVAIIGILSMFAVPAYQDYTKKIKITEAISIADGYKIRITEACTTKGNKVSKNDSNACDTGDYAVEVADPVDKIAKITVENNIITIEFDPSFINGQLMQVGIFRDDPVPSITWECAASDSALYRFLPKECQQSVAEVNARWTND